MELIIPRSEFYDFQKGFVHAHTRNGKQVASFFTKRPPGKVGEKHTRDRFIDHSKETATKSHEDLESKKGKHQVTIDALKNELSRLKKEGPKSEEKGLSHSDKLSHLNQHIKNEQQHVENHSRKQDLIKNRYKIAGKQHERKRSKSDLEKKISPHSDAQKDTIRKIHSEHEKSGTHDTGRVLTGKDKNHVYLERRNKETGDTKHIAIHKDGSIKDPNILHEGKFDHKELKDEQALTEKRQIVAKKEDIETKKKEVKKSKDHQVFPKKMTFPQIQKYFHENDAKKGMTFQLGDAKSSKMNKVVAVEETKVTIQMENGTKHEIKIDPKVKKEIKSDRENIERIKQKIVKAKAKVSEIEKTEAEKKETRSQAMKGNKNAYKGGQKDEPKKVKPKKEEDEFDRSTREYDEREKRNKDAIKKMKQDHGEVSFSMKNPDVKGGTIMVHPSSKPGGGWQASFIDQKGADSDIRKQSYDELLKEMLSEQPRLELNKITIQKPKKTKPSKQLDKLNENQKKIEDWKAKGVKSDSFKSWFGDWENISKSSSKVVNTKGEPKKNNSIGEIIDHNGMPIPMYHGTGFGGFSKFNKEKIGDSNWFGEGFYFTEDKKVAKEYSRSGENTPYPEDHATGIKNKSGDELQYIPKDIVSKFLEKVKFYNNNKKLGIIKNSGSGKKMYDTDYYDYGIYQSLKNVMNEKGVSVKKLFNELSNPNRIDIDKNSDLGKSEYSGANIRKSFLFRRFEELSPIIPKPEIKEVYLNIRKPFDMTLIANKNEINSLLKSYDTEINIGSILHKKDLNEIGIKDKVMSTDLKYSDILNIKKKMMEMVHESSQQESLLSEAWSKGDRIHPLMNRTKKGEFSVEEFHHIITNLKTKKDSHKFSNFLKNKGYDGIAHEGGYNFGSRDHKVWIAFEPNQIKSTNNIGTFDQKSDILEKSFQLKTLEQKEEDLIKSLEKQKLLKEKRKRRKKRKNK